MSDTVRRAGREELSDAAGAVMAEAAAWGVEVEGGHRSSGGGGGGCIRH